MNKDIMNRLDKLENELETLRQDFNDVKANIGIDTNTERVM